MPIIIKDVSSSSHSGRTFYTGWMSVADIFDAVFVPVTKKTKLPKTQKAIIETLEEREGGYQRCATRARQYKIAKYYLETPLAIIPPVLLSDRGLWKWDASENGTIGTLKIDEKAAVVDGQHRLGGLRLYATMDGADKERRLPFIVVANLPIEEEKKEFLTINTTQKGVPKAHTAFLESDRWWNFVALSLNESGPFEGRIQAAGGVREPWHLDLKLHSVANAIHDCFEAAKDKADVWGFETDDERKDEMPALVIRYWELIAEVFADEFNDLERLPYPEHLGRGGGEGNTRQFEYKLLELTGFIAWMWFLEQFAVNIWNSNTKTLNETELLKYLTWIRETEEPFYQTDGTKLFRKVVEWDKTGKFVGRTGGAGAKPILEEMVRIVQNRISEESEK